MTTVKFVCRQMFPTIHNGSGNYVVLVVDQTRGDRFVWVPTIISVNHFWILFMSTCNMVISLKFKTGYKKNIPTRVWKCLSIMFSGSGPVDAGYGWFFVLLFGSEIYKFTTKFTIWQKLQKNFGIYNLNLKHDILGGSFDTLSNFCQESVLEKEMK